jgi:hypothetical protein
MESHDREHAFRPEEQRPDRRIDDQMVRGLTVREADKRMLGEPQARVSLTVSANGVA